jgi:hypothetical protein
VLKRSSRINLDRGVRFGFSALPLVYFLLVRILHVPNFDSIGILPYKDAAAWRLCAKSLSLTGSFPDGFGNWCNRRPLFAEFSGLIFRLTGSDFTLLAIFALTFSISLYFLIRELEDLVSAKSRIVVAFFCLFLWILFGANLFLSEALAIPLGVAFTTFILRFFRNQSLMALTLSAFTISLLQNTRPSNLFLIGIPIFLLFLNKKIKYGFIPILVGIISPFVLTELLGKSAQLSEYNNAGNAWATLYGLIRQNADWRLAYSELGPISDISDYGTSQEIKNMVLEELRTGPDGAIIDFVQSIFFNLYAMTTSSHLFFLPGNFSIPFVGKFLSIMLISAITWKLVKFKLNPTNNNSFVIALYVGATTFLSFATYWKSEAPRVLSSALIFALVIWVLPSNFSARTVDSKVTLNSSTKILLTPILTVIIVFLGFLSNHSLKDFSDGMKSPSCTIGEFYFLKGSVISESIENVKQLGLFEWEKSIGRLPQGYLSLGLGVDDNQVVSIQTFTKMRPEENWCYKFATLSKDISSLKDMGFTHSR